MDNIDPVWLRADIHVLQKIIDTALDEGDHRMLKAAAEVLRQRREQLEELERLAVTR